MVFFLLFQVVFVAFHLGNSLNDTTFNEFYNDRFNSTETENTLQSVSHTFPTAEKPPTHSTPDEKTENTCLSHIGGHLVFIDKLLQNYDKRAWPTFGTNNPTTVTVNMHINRLESVSAANMDFGMDIYLRQSWVDPRLRSFKLGINSSVTLNGEDTIDKIWKPDLFFRNLKSGNFHMLTVPNKLIRLSPDGNILFSVRLTLRLSCHMSFRLYPLDIQRCWVVFGSYVYGGSLNVSEIVGLYSSIVLAQYLPIRFSLDIVDVQYNIQFASTKSNERPTDAQTTDQVIVKWRGQRAITMEEDIEVPEFNIVPQLSGEFYRNIDTGVFSFLNVSFILLRQNGYHLIQTYLPTFLIVMMSWVSFWVPVESAPARVTLGVTTLLSLTTVAAGIRSQLPPVSYAKAIDVWIGACLLMVFAALLEFAVSSYLSRMKIRHDKQKSSCNLFRKHTREGETFDEENRSAEYTPESDKKLQMRRSHAVDRFSRIGFPFIFLVFNMFYWVYYLTERAKMSPN